MPQVMEHVDFTSTLSDPCVVAADQDVLALGSSCIEANVFDGGLVTASGIELDETAFSSGATGSNIG